MTGRTKLLCSSMSLDLNGRMVLDDVDLEVETGEWITLIGPNGAGKTSLLRALAGLLPHRGTVLIETPDGAMRDVRHDLSVRARARLLAYVPQQPTVPVGLTVLQYVLLGRAAHVLYFGIERHHDHDVAQRSLDVLGLDRLSNRRVEEVSGGEWRRVVLARALTQEADLLLLDEPTSSLDIGHQQEVLELVDLLRREQRLAVVSTMHELTLAGQYSDRLLLLAGGRIVARGPAAEVLTSETIGEHYRASVRVEHSADGITLSPLRRHRSSNRPISS